MTNIDRDAPRTIETHVTYDPLGPGSSEVTRTTVHSNAAGWWVGGIIAVVAIIAIAFMVTRSQPPVTDQALVAAATAQGAQAQSAQDAAAVAQANAQASIQASQAAAQGQVDRAAASGAAAQAAAAQAAGAAQDARAGARDAAATTQSPPSDGGDSQ